jgi:hypothetical protein
MYFLLFLRHCCKDILTARNNFNSSLFNKIAILGDSLEKLTSCRSKKVVQYCLQVVLIVDVWHPELAKEAAKDLSPLKVRKRSVLHTCQQGRSKIPKIKGNLALPLY